MEVTSVFCSLIFSNFYAFNKLESYNSKNKENQLLASRDTTRKRIFLDGQPVMMPFKRRTNNSHKN